MNMISLKILGVYFSILDCIELNALREKCTYLELIWSVFSRVWSEYREIRNISPYLVRMREYTDQNSSKYRYLLGSDIGKKILKLIFKRF